MKNKFSNYLPKVLTAGFTLIELLVVIAIIGILSSIVLASLNSARNKGVDAAVKSSLDNMRAQGELFYDSNTSSYANVCGAAPVNGVNSVLTGIQTASTAVGSGAVVTTVNNVNHLIQGAGTAVCYDSPGAWISEVPIKTLANTYWCVDNSGNSKQTGTLVPANTFVCQ